VFQVKRRKKVTPHTVVNGLYEADNSCTNGEYAVCVHRSDRERWKATMFLEDILRYTGMKFDVSGIPPIMVEMALADFIDLKVYYNAII
jgi:hypothetical protein